MEKECAKCKARYRTDIVKITVIFAIVFVIFFYLLDSSYKNEVFDFSPSDIIKEEQIHVFDNRVVIDVNNTIYARFSDTNSMTPVLDIGHNSIEKIPDTPNDIKVGDIISYESNIGDGVYIHRVVKKGIDGEGIFFVLRGDNLRRNDPEKVRFGQVKGVVVAIIY